MEIWKDIKGYEGLYQVSNLGRVRSVAHIDDRKRHLKGKLLSQAVVRGYLCVGLSVGGKLKSYKVHRLVASAFIENPDVVNFNMVNHKDEDKLNNCVDNLEWCDCQYNNTYGKMKNISVGENNGNSKLNTKQVIEIRKTHIPRNRDFGTKPLAEKYGVTVNTINKILNRKTWGAIA